MHFAAITCWDEIIMDLDNANPKVLPKATYKYPRSLRATLRCDVKFFMICVATHVLIYSDHAMNAEHDNLHS